MVGRIIRVRLEEDRDYHVALTDPMDAIATWVAEVADTGCQGAAQSPYMNTLAHAHSIKRRG